MKLSQRKFNKLVKKGWNNMIPDAGNLPHQYQAGTLSRDSTRFQNLSAAIIFCLLFTSLFFVPVKSRLSIDLKNLSELKVVSYLFSMSFPEGKK